MAVEDRFDGFNLRVCNDHRCLITTEDAAGRDAKNGGNSTSITCTTWHLSFDFAS